VAGSAKDEVKQLMLFVVVGLTFEAEDKGGISVNCLFVNCHFILCVLCVFGGFVSPPLAFLLDWWEARLPFFAFEQERVVVVVSKKKAPAEAPAAHLS